MSKFQVGDRVRLLEDFDDIKSGTVGIVQSVITGGYDLYDIFVKFETQENQTLLYDEEVEFVSHAPSSLDDVSNEEWNQAQAKIATLPEDFKPLVRFGDTPAWTVLGASGLRGAKWVEDKENPEYRGFEFDNAEDAIAYIHESDAVTQPAHYTSHPSGIETIEITKHESFLRGNLLKYILLAPYKGAELEDLLKAQKYLEWEIARVEGQEK